MQVYFVSATYTNNVYKLSDFYDGSNYRLNLDKMLDINLKADDGIASFITKHIELPDETSVRDHTHIIVPELSKIYKISSIDYNNISQYTIILDEDPLIANYQTLKDRDIILTRTNDQDLFRGINDIADMTLEETVTTFSIESQFKTGKWALVFISYDKDDEFVGFNYRRGSGFPLNRETFSSISAMTTKYPEVATDFPSTFTYFQKIVTVDTGSSTQDYQCVYYEDGMGYGQLLWIEYVPYNTQDQVWAGISFLTLAKINDVEVQTACIALPFENDLFALHEGVWDRLMSFNEFIGPIDVGRILDIKIVDGNLMPAASITYNLSGRSLEKRITGISGTAKTQDVLETPSVPSQMPNYTFGYVLQFIDDIDISGIPIITPKPTDAEPFYKYDLYIYGKKFNIPYFLSNDIHIKIAMTVGVVNYIIYYKTLRNILASGSFTHSIKYQVDNLDAFYTQNPTYKEQFFTKMGVDAMKGVIGGAVAGSVVPGIGTAVGAVGGLLSSGVDAGISMLNLHYMEKGLKLKPDQIFGEISEISMQTKNIFGIYWVKRWSENIDLMLNEYYLRGFPTTSFTSISDLSYETSIFGTSKIVFGELKTIIRNNYVTGFINQKLKEGIILIP